MSDDKRSVQPDRGGEDPDRSAITPGSDRRLVSRSQKTDRPTLRSSLPPRVSPDLTSGAGANPEMSQTDNARTVASELALLRGKEPGGPGEAVAAFTGWLKSRGDEESLVAIRKIEAREARYEDWPDWVDPRLVTLYKSRGISRLYTHQASALAAQREGSDVVVVTPTASGKTLCYNVPVLHEILQDPNSRALYLFPTKALAQDQLAELNGLIDGLGVGIKSYTYDGDTPGNARKSIRLAGHIVVTNPDMLHTGILPHHTKWHRLFSQLRYVVIDEMHSYRGLFGSHVANVLRRLWRICEHYGSRPKLVLCSATIANPLELAERLTGRKLALIDGNGAPSGEKHFVFFNPPVVNRQLGLRASSLLTARRIASELIRRGTHTIVFARSRLSVEVMLTYLRDDLEKALRKPDLVRGYRGGYLPNQRREIERGLRDGSVIGVVSTNALELGIDIGGLDACVLVGYPGTVASTWQQVGRAGRGRGTSVAVLVGTSSPLDQFIMYHPDYFFGQAAESGLINPDNLYIFVSHIKCAAFELPFRDGEKFGGQEIDEVLDYLVEHEVLHHSGQRWHWSSEAFPGEEVSLRSASAENVVIVDQTDSQRPRIIGNMDRLSAATMLHDEAIYIHESQQYEVLRLDWDEKKAYVRAVDVDYYTDANLALRLEVLDDFVRSTDEYENDDGNVGALFSWGEVALTLLATIYKKIKLNTHENVGWGKIRLPEDNLHTTAFWLALPQNIVKGWSQAEIQEGLLGLSHILVNVAPLYLMCDPRDLGVHPEVRAPFTGLPTVFIYDNVPGGIGLAEKLFGARDEIVAAGRDAVSECGCESGCPSCVGVASEPTLDIKALSLALLASL